MKKLRVIVGDKTYEVSVEVLGEDQSVPSAPSSPPSASPVSSTPVEAPAPTPPPAPRPSGGGGSGDVTSPLAGKIVAVDVKPGHQVEEGDQIITVEAMKMNTYVYAPVSGKVTEVLVSPGEGVEEGQLLLRIA